MKKTHSNISNPSDWWKWRVEPDGVVTNGKMLRIFSAGGTKAKMQIGNFIAAAPEMYECLEEAVKWACLTSGCGCYSDGKCIGTDGVCGAQKWINTLKKARGEK